jgi:hypothetical protein
MDKVFYDFEDVLSAPGQKKPCDLNCKHSLYDLIQGEDTSDGWVTKIWGRRCHKCNIMIIEGESREELTPSI